MFKHYRMWIILPPQRSCSYTLHWETAMILVGLDDYFYINVCTNDSRRFTSHVRYNWCIATCRSIWSLQGLVWMAWSKQVCTGHCVVKVAGHLYQCLSQGISYGSWSGSGHSKSGSLDINCGSITHFKRDSSWSESEAQYLETQIELKELESEREKPPVSTWCYCAVTECVREQSHSFQVLWGGRGKI